MKKTDKGFVIGLDIGGTYIRIGSRREKSKLLFLKRVFTREVLKGRDSANSLINFLQEYIEENLKNEKIDAVSIGFPSTLSKDRRTVLQTPNIEGMDDINFVEALSNVFDFPVFLERDVNLIMLSDMEDYKLPTEGVVIGVYIGTGIGNAIAINGSLLKGKDGVAGELGHIPMMGSLSVCGCGNIGCSECHASGKHLTEIGEKYFPDTSVGELFIKHGDSSIIKEFIDNIASVVATEVNILNPEYIIMGGGVINMEGFPKDYFEKCLYKRTRKPYPADNLSIIYAKEDFSSGVNGAIYYACQKLKI